MREEKKAAPAAVEGPSGLDHCPITGRKFWGNIEHPELGLVATYGGPFDTYTIPAISDDGELRCERFDQDAGHWVEGGEPAGWLSDDQPDSAPTTQAAPQPAVQQGDDFWPVDGKASRKQLIEQIGQMNYQLTALRQENAGLIARTKGQAEALQNYQTSAAPVAQGDALPREDFAWMVVQEACDTEPADEDDPECIRILRIDLKSAVLAAFLRLDAARAQAKEGGA